MNCLYFWALYFRFLIVESDPYSDMKDNFAMLLTAYESNNSSTSLTNIIPKNDQTEALEITMNMAIYALSGFDAVAGQVEIVGSIQMSWYDEISSNKFTYNDVTSIVVPQTTIWTPSIVLVNAIDTVKKIGSSTYRPRYSYNDGFVEWNPRVILKAACDPDVTYYPFDQQTCSFIFTPWMYSSTQINLTLSSTTIDASQFDLNSAWSLVETKAETYISEERYYANFTITIQRENLYFTINLVMPILLLAAVTGFVFLLPAASNERIAFSITCFLSFVVLLQTMMQYLPESSSPMSLLSFYLTVMMMFSAVVCLITIMTLRLYQSAERGDSVPGFLKTFVQIIQCTICRRCKKSSSNKDNAELNVDWATVGRLLDIFFFIAFLAAQGGFTFLFLLPLGLKS
ncbi:hypothetical protein CHS0354_011346 [Potamilus streckersoni]|uniref:Uncharacterized protein n=1 Tax=Potamilus streckersoni TaxID=2493646 RepID=A0AAE0TFU3_9BIVA|nr:hypothetical protein CHS0354_011346 [Potamilus streckersoni]